MIKRSVMPPIISIVGKSESGKTTLIEKLIPVLRSRGYRVGILKHAFHKLEIDKKGKDSWRHKNAGAETVVVSAPGTIVMVKDSREESIDALNEYFQDMDLVITEGFKNENKPRIEVFRQANNDTPISNGNHNLIALVTDADVDIKIPVFGLEDVKPLADLIEKKFL
ncbi:molybdopterin-guanine dinucleotide biosynthesis protein B [Thermodesulfobacteriota bacterium]